ncbi:hypothetical protein N8203_04425, partial [Crocinitomicaceae bacterium]|nr:hypothetical protein [Crocinitomicaceae bacterium]
KGRCWSDVSLSEVHQFVNQSNAHVEKMLEYAISDVKDSSWRVAWLLERSLDKSDEIIQKYNLKIIKSIIGKECGHQRELLKLIIDRNLSEEEEGRLFKICLNIWKDVHKKSGTRFYAFNYIHKIVAKYPELQNELVGLFDRNYLETLSPGIQRGIQKKTSTFL